MKILKIDTYNFQQYKLKQVKGLYRNKTFDIGKFYEGDNLIASFIKVYEAGRLKRIQLKSRNSIK